MSVLVLGAVGAAIALSLIMLGIGNSRTSFAYEQSAEAESLAQACAEEGLEQIKTSAGYTGNGNLAYDLGSCTYAVTTQSGQDMVTATGTDGTIVHTVTVMLSAVTPSPTISSWQDQ